MVEKVPSPFDSPFVKVGLAVSWLVYAGMLVTLVVERDAPLLLIALGWTFALPWIT